MRHLHHPLSKKVPYLGASTARGLQPTKPFLHKKLTCGRVNSRRPFWPPFQNHPAGSSWTLGIQVRCVRVLVAEYTRLLHVSCLWVHFHYHTRQHLFPIPLVSNDRFLKAKGQLRERDNEIQTTVAIDPYQERIPRSTDSLTQGNREISWEYPMSKTRTYLVAARPPSGKEENVPCMAATPLAFPFFAHLLDLPPACKKKERRPPCLLTHPILDLKMPHGWRRDL